MTAFPSFLPTPRTPDPMQAPSLRWGVLGPGWIAERFVTAVQRSTTQQVVAVGSRTLQRSAEFADRFDVATAHGSYQALVSDPAVDVIYVATPHNAHFPCAALAVEAGKHVLVEKPIGLNAGEAAGSRNSRPGAACSAWRRCGPSFCRSSTSSANCSPTVRSGRSTRCRPITASTSIPATESCAPSWRVGRCWTSAPTRSRSQPGCWALRAECWPPDRTTRQGSTVRSR